MTTNALLPVVETHPFVAGLDAPHIEKLADMAREICFDKGVVIFEEGDHGREFYLLVKGMVSLEISSGTLAHRVQTLYPGDEFGWSSLISGQGKVLQARSLDRVDVLVFDGEELHQTFLQDPSFGLSFTFRLLGVVSERLAAARLQLLDFYAMESRRAGT